MPRTATVKKLRPLPEFPLDSHPEVSLDFTRVKQDLREMDRSLQQFLEIATSQEAMKNR